MNADERRLVSSALVLLALLTLGMLLHRSPDFAGSLSGSALGIVGAVLMVLPTLVYLLTKRVAALKRYVTRSVPLNTLLGWHVYTSIAGSLLAMLHTGHKFNSILGTMLVGVMLLAVITGFAARYLVRSISATLKEKRELMTALELEYRQVVASPVTAVAGASFAERIWPWQGKGPSRRAVDLAAGMAEVQYSITMHDTLAKIFRWALRLHVIFAFAFLLLLGLHVWAGVHFGLRWLP